MSNDRCNKSIHCTVEQCANHCPTASYCALTALPLARTRLIQRWISAPTVSPSSESAADFPSQCRRSRICPTPFGLTYKNKALECAALTSNPAEHID